MKHYKNLGLTPEQILEDVAAGVNAMRRANPEVDAEYSVCWKCGCSASVHDEGTGLAVGLSEDMKQAVVYPHCKDHPEAPADGPVHVHCSLAVPLVPKNAKAFLSAILRDAVRAMRHHGISEGLVRPTHAFAADYPCDVAMLVILPPGKNRLPSLRAVPYPWVEGERPGNYGLRGDALAMAQMPKGTSSTVITGGRGPFRMVTVDMQW